METLKMELRVSARDLSWLAAFIGGAYILGAGLMLGVCLIWKIDEYGPIGTFCALIGILVAILTRRNLNPHNRLRMAVCMGVPRWRFIAADALLTALESAVSVLAVWGLSALELLLYRSLFGQAEYTFGPFELFRWQYALLYILGLTVFNLFLTAFMNRFGIKGFFCFWIPIWLLNPLLTPAIYAAENGEQSLMAGVGRAALWIIGVCARIPGPLLAGIALAAAVGISLLMLRRCEVKL